MLKLSKSAIPLPDNLRNNSKVTQESMSLRRVKVDFGVVTIIVRL